MWPLSDEALLTGFATGDPDAAAGFVRRYQRRVYGLALTILGDPGAAEDVAQETFVRAWRHAGTFDPRRAPLSSWLLTIARNLALSRARLKRAPPVDPDVLTMQLADETSGVEEAGRIADREQLRELLLGLPERQRRALVLAIYFGCTASEIAELEQVPLGTAKTRIRDGLQKLRNHTELRDGWV